MKNYGGPEGRLFIAAELPAQMREALAAYALEIEPLFPGRYAAPVNYHVTLAFLGQTPLAAVPDLESILLESAMGKAPIDVRLDQPGFFGRRNSAILWAGLTGHKLLESLARQIRGGLDLLAIPHDIKPPRTHITLARKVDVTDRQLPALPRSEGQISDVTVFHSTREDGQLVYLPLATVYLKG